MMARLYASVKVGDQIKFVPLRATLDADGLAVLQVDTELKVDAATLNIDNLFVASTDGTTGNARYIKVLADGSLSVTGGFVCAGVPKHYNGVANIAPATVTFAGTTCHIQVDAVDKTLYISFDSGANWKTIQEGYTWDMDATVGSIDIRAATDGIDYEILTLEPA